MKHTHTAASAALVVRALLAPVTARTWPEYFDGAHKANAWTATKLVQEQVNGPLRQEPCSYREASLAVQDAIPELFAEYWETLKL